MNTTTELEKPSETFKSRAFSILLSKLPAKTDRLLLDIIVSESAKENDGELEEAAAVISTLQAQLGLAQHGFHVHCEALQSQLTAAQNDVKLLTETIQGLRTDLENAATRESTLGSTNRELLERIERLEADLDTANSSAFNLSKELERLQNAHEPEALPVPVVVGKVDDVKPKKTKADQEEERLEKVAVLIGQQPEYPKYHGRIQESELPYVLMQCVAEFVDGVTMLQHVASSLHFQAAKDARAWFMWVSWHARSLAGLNEEEKRTYKKALLARLNNDFGGSKK